MCTVLMVDIPAREMILFRFFFLLTVNSSCIVATLSHDYDIEYTYDTVNVTTFILIECKLKNNYDFNVRTIFW